MQNIAIPHLYHHLFIENHDNLSRLASLFLTTPLDHPRSIWVKTLNFSFTKPDDFDENLYPITNLNISNWLTVIFTRVRLRSCTIKNPPLHDGAISALLMSSRDCLSHLSLIFDQHCLHLLHLVPLFVNLRSLYLNFDGEAPLCMSDESEDYSDIVPADFASIHTLCMPHIKDVRFEWSSGPFLNKKSLIQYLAASHFHSNCDITINFTSTSTREMTAFNPIFLEHCKNDIVIDSTCTSHQSTIFAHSRSVQFLSNVPPLVLFSVPNLPRFISLNLETPHYVDYLWQILDTLAESPQNGLIYFRLLTTFDFDYETSSSRSESPSDSSPRAAIFRWKMSPQEANAHKIWQDFIPKMTRYAHALVAKGIVLLDGDLKNVIGDIA